MWDIIAASKSRCEAESGALSQSVLAGIALVTVVLGSCTPNVRDSETLWVSPEGLFLVEIPQGWQAHEVPHDASHIALFAGPPGALTSNNDFQACQVVRSETEHEHQTPQAELNSDTERYAAGSLLRFESVSETRDMVRGILIFRADGILRNGSVRFRQLERAFRVPVEGGDVIYLVMCSASEETVTAGIAGPMHSFFDSFRLIDE